jgi:hypothetical protein
MVYARAARRFVPTAPSTAELAAAFVALRGSELTGRAEARARPSGIHCHALHAAWLHCACPSHQGCRHRRQRDCRKACERHSRHSHRRPGEKNRFGELLTCRVRRLKMLGRGLQNLLATSRRRLAPRAAAAVVQGAAHRSLCDGAPAANPPGELHPQRKLLRLKKEELVSTARALGLPVSALDAHPDTPALPVAGPPGPRSSPYVHVHISSRTYAYRLGSLPCPKLTGAASADDWQQVRVGRTHQPRARGRAGGCRCSTRAR